MKQGRPLPELLYGRSSAASSKRTYNAARQKHSGRTVAAEL